MKTIAPIKITLTEQRLCKIWAAAQMGGDFYETSKMLHEIAAVLKSVGKKDVGEIFDDMSALALHRAIEDIKAPTNKEWNAEDVWPLKQAVAA